LLTKTSNENIYWETREDKVYGSNAKNYSYLITHTQTHTQNQFKYTWFHLTASQW